jgi:hypothetical protein
MIVCGGAIVRARAGGGVGVIVCVGACLGANSVAAASLMHCTVEAKSSLARHLTKQELMLSFSGTVLV